MNKELFASMRSQMTPSPEARAGLQERLTQAPMKKPVPYKRYIALAACLTLVVAAVPVSRWWKWQKIVNNLHPGTVAEPVEPHGYIVVDAQPSSPQDTASAGAITTSDGGDSDQDMTPGELTDNMLEAGFSQEDVDEYLASVWQMTWAKWWKFIHQTEESGERTLEALLEFSREELAVNTGDLPGGAYVSDVPSQETAVMAYQNLMSQFEKNYGLGAYPEWYGGAYIDGNGQLIVNIVEEYEPEDENLFLRIQDWAGTDSVSFGNVKYGLGYLRDLQDRTFEAMSDLGLAVGCGVNEETGQVELDLSEITDEALQILTELDPMDETILVRVGKAVTTQIIPSTTEITVDSAQRDGYVHIPAPAENGVQPENLPANTEEAISADPIEEP